MNILSKLYEHQIKAVDKLSKVKVGAEYMEMGTGKTLVTLELIKRRLDKGKINHVLWLCPCSIKETVRRNIIKHTGEDQKELITICGIETLSSSIKTNIDLSRLVEETKCHLVVDESNLIKNFKAIRTQRIIELSKRCTYKVILNGTPITRNEADLFAQWYVLDWRILGYKSYWSFERNHIVYHDMIPNKIVKTINTEYLVKKIALYSYQIKKEECIQLPPKTYSTEYYWLTDEQQEHYDEIAEQLLFKVNEIRPETIFRLFTGLQNVISGFLVDAEGKELTKSYMFKNPKNNPRIELLLDIISRLEGKKIIIFCKYTKEINDIVNVLNGEYGNNSAVAYNGKVSQKHRQQNIDKFESESRFFVANKACGAYGLNLQFCNYIIYYSNDWDYGTRNQSEDRVHRIGQTKNVHIIDICASNTLDERIIDCLYRKEQLLDSFKDELQNTKDKSELYSWLSLKNSKGNEYNKQVKIEKYEDLIEN